MKGSKEKMRLFIPLAIVAGFLAYCWTLFAVTDAAATWKHYLGLYLFLFIIYLAYSNSSLALIATGIYLLLGVFGLLAMTAHITTHGIRIGPISTPEVQLPFLGLFLLYFVSNFNHLVDIYLDYKEGKPLKK